MLKIKIRNQGPESAILIEMAESQSWREIEEVLNLVSQTVNEYKDG